MQTERARELATLIWPLAEGADVGQIACSAVSTWRGIDAALAPVIGRRGVAALYERSVCLVRAEYPWLPAVQARGPEVGAFGSLQAALVLQTRSEAAATQGALLRAFADLLSSLVGRSLTDRLLNAVRDRPAPADSSL
jgi:hypothetical protein